MKEGKLSLGMFEILLLFLEGTQSVIIWRGVARCALLGVNINFLCWGGFKDTIVLGLLNQGMNVLNCVFLNTLNPKIINRPLITKRQTPSLQ